MEPADPPYDAVLIVAFGGPEGPDEVMPFLENVLRGRNVPRERMLEVAEHYDRFGGVSPINAQMRALVYALVAATGERGPNLPIYWGNRNWHPMLADTIEQMAEDGIQNALAFFTSPYSSYSSCRQYRENVEAAREEVGPRAPKIHKLRAYFNHPRLIEAVGERVRAVLDRMASPFRDVAPVLFTAHSIPAAMAAGCRYESQLRESSRLVCEREDIAPDRWELVFQSRSGAPGQPWLEPDIRDRLREIQKHQAPSDVVVVPIGYLSDHMEVIYDLDFEAAGVCSELGIRMHRAATVGTHPALIEMIRQLIEERTSGATVRPTLGDIGAAPDVCPEDCCPAG